MKDEIIGFILGLFGVVAVAWVAFWLIDQGVPEPFRLIAKAAVALVALAVLLIYFVPSVL